MEINKEKVEINHFHAGKAMPFLFRPSLVFNAFVNNGTKFAICSFYYDKM